MTITVNWGWWVVPTMITVFTLVWLVIKFPLGGYRGDYDFSGVFDAMVWLIGILFVVVTWLIWALLR